MNKFIRKVIGMAAAIITLAFINTEVYAAGATLTGPSVVRAGDTITLNLNISDSGKYGAEGTFAYDSNQVTLTGVVSQRAGWKVELNGNSLVAYDDNLSNPTSGNSVIATATFTVNSNVAAGTAIKISVDGFTASDGSTESNYGSVVYQVSVAKPLSTVNTLSDIKVDGCNITPQFNSSTTSYNAGEVDFNVTSLKITATPGDSTARVNISGNNLAVGNNTVTITVTAENGSQKNYQITVVRKQDPNYVASSNANLSTITVSQGKISPAFSGDITDYVVYLPYEEMGTAFSISGSAEDSKATNVSTATIDELKYGANSVQIVCTAEDGSTKEYKITVVVLPEYSGILPEIGDMPTEEPTIELETEEITTEEVTTEEVTTENNVKEEPQKDNDSKGLPVWVAFVVAAVGIGAGFGISYLIIFLKNKKAENE